MKSASFLRASGFVGPAAIPDTLTIIGCGAVGSHVAVAAAKMGWTKFQLFDADSVEPHNLPNQTFEPQDIDSLKVDALERVLKVFNPNIQVTKHPLFFESALHKDLIKGPLVIATDSMKSRQDITDAFEFNPFIPAVLEARLSFDYAEVHRIDPSEFNQITEWKASLKDDSEIPDGPCNLRICTTLVGVVSSTLVHLLCLPYASRRNDTEWVIPFRTRMSMIDTLIVRTKSV